MWCQHMRLILVTDSEHDELAQFEPSPLNRLSIWCDNWKTFNNWTFLIKGVNEVGLLHMFVEHEES